MSQKLAKPEKFKRLSQALRANLQKRKEQQRHRQETQKKKGTPDAHTS